MAKSTPIVRSGVLRNPSPMGYEQWVIESNPEAWQAFIRRNDKFAYFGAVKFTARREKRRGSMFWYAYVRSKGKLYNAYIGTDDQMTEDRLTAVGRELRDKIQKHEREIAMQDTKKSSDLSFTRCDKHGNLVLAGHQCASCLAASIVTTR